jgi:tripartite-type tricarboxylate transporter receptor subunit TctC
MTSASAPGSSVPTWSQPSARAAPRLAQAAWPDRPVRIIVAFPPGSSTDVLCRALGQALKG